MSKLIERDRSIIPACDFDSLKKFEDIIKETAGIPEVGAYKIGATLGLTHGLPSLVKVARRHTNKPLIYDHQKAGTDIPDTGKAFMHMLRDAGINSIIIFPFTGPATQTAWIEAALEAGLNLICGGHMTHKNFIASDGGYIDDAAIDKIYSVAANMGITDFVVPGNKPEIIEKIKKSLISNGIDPIFYSPGFVSQGGKISEATKAAGSKWHAIVGRAIYESPNIKKEIEILISQL